MSVLQCFFPHTRERVLLGPFAGLGYYKWYYLGPFSGHCYLVLVLELTSGITWDHFRDLPNASMFTQMPRTAPDVMTLDSIH